MVFASTDFGNMLSTLNIINSDVEAKTIRCAISYLEAMRVKDAQGSENVQVNRQRLLNHLNLLQMEQLRYTQVIVIVIAKAASVVINEN